MLHVNNEACFGGRRHLKTRFVVVSLSLLLVGILLALIWWLFWIFHFKHLMQVSGTGLSLFLQFRAGLTFDLTSRITYVFLAAEDVSIWPPGFLILISSTNCILTSNLLFTKSNCISHAFCAFYITLNDSIAMSIKRRDITKLCDDSVNETISLFVCNKKKLWK